MALNQTRLLSNERLIQESEDRRDVKSRFVDLCLLFRRGTDKSIILSSGGRWDRLNNVFDSEPSKRCKIIDLEESQFEFTSWFATWLNAFRNNAHRDTRLVLAGGERRGGKTFDLLLCTIAAVLDTPGRIGWMVSSSYQERDELDQTIRKYIPAGWYTYRGCPKYQFTFHNGSILKNISADDPETLKRGRVDIAFLNEAQKMPMGALSNSIPGIIDAGGLVIMAANPPRRIIGEWVLTLKEAIDEKRISSAKFFGFKAELNTHIDQHARKDVGQILSIIDPRAAQADDEGMWIPVGDQAYFKFSSKDNVRAVPDIVDITGELTERKVGRRYSYINGADFQATPFMAGIALKVYRGIDGRSIFWVVGEVLREGTEDDFLDTVDDKTDWTPETAVWIGDASGTWQDGAHKTRGRVSFDIFKSRRWHIHPPQRKRTEQGDHPRNPAIEDRLSLVNKLLAEGRLMIDPDGAPRVAIALKKCELKNHRPRGKYAHITDALGYALWWIEPKPQTRKPGAKLEAWSVASARQSPNW